MHEKVTRRGAVLLGLGTAATSPLAAAQSSIARPRNAIAPDCTMTSQDWAKGIEGQRRADRGDGPRFGHLAI
jgi:hypothetical protein